MNIIMQGFLIFGIAAVVIVILGLVDYCVKDFLNEQEKRSMRNNCYNCKEPTKHVVGFWDGKNDSNGCLYDCNNKSCKVKIMIDSSKDKDMTNRINVQKINGENNVSISCLKIARLDAGIPTFNIANYLDIPVVVYNSYENEQTIMPKELYDKAISFVTNLSEQKKLYEKN